MDAQPAQLLPRLEAAERYVKSRTWDNAAKILADTLNRVIDQKGTRANGETETPFALAAA